jgi:hypothetical protein
MVATVPRDHAVPVRCGLRPQVSRRRARDARLVQRHGVGLASLNADDVRVVAIRNFAEAVARATGNPTYTADRGSGVAAARTVTGPGGSVVFVNYGEVSSRPPADIQRLLAHEGGHVRIDARVTEETSGNRDPGEADWHWWPKALGAQAIVEFRIEQRLAELGYPAAEWAAADHVDHALQVTNVEVVSAATDTASADPARLQDALLQTTGRTTHETLCRDDSPTADLSLVTKNATRASSPVP